MWTIRQANRVALGVDILFAAVVLALAVRIGLDGSWFGALFCVTGLIFVGYRIRRRRRRTGEFDERDTLASRARDEREAYIQLRAWATVGQVTLLVLLSTLVVQILRGEFLPWVWPLLGFAVVEIVSLRWLKSRA